MRKKSNFKSNILFWYVLLSALIIFLLVSVFSVAIQSNDNYFMISLGILPSIMLVYTQIKMKASDVFSPINFVLLTTFIGVTLQTSNSVFGLQEHEGLDKSLYSGLFAINLGILFLIVGFLVNIKISIPKLKIFKHDNWSIKRAYFVVILLTATSIYSFYLYFTLFDIGSDFLSSYSVKRRIDVSTGIGTSYTSYGYITWLADLIQIAFFILLTIFLGKLSKKRVSGFSLVASLFIILLYGLASITLPFITSSRLLLFLVIIIALMIINYTYKAITIKKILLFIIAAAVLSSTMEGLRTIQTKGTNEDISINSTSLSSIYKVFAESDNFLGVSKTAILVDSVPDYMDFQYGRTFLLWTIAPIPRTYWPDKPIIKIGGILGEKIYGRPAGSGVPPGYIGELYLNFGWIGIPLGMFLLGLWLRFLYNNFRKHKENKNIIIVYILAMLPSTFILLVGEFSGVVIHILTSIVPLYLVLTFITKPVKHSLTNR